MSDEISAIKHFTIRKPESIVELFKFVLLHEDSLFIATSVLTAYPTSISNPSLKTLSSLSPFSRSHCGKMKTSIRADGRHANAVDYHEKWPTKIASCLLNASHANYLGVGSCSFIVLAIFTSAGVQEEPHGSFL